MVGGFCVRVYVCVCGLCDKCGPFSPFDNSIWNLSILFKFAARSELKIIFEWMDGRVCEISATIKEGKKRKNKTKERLPAVVDCRDCGVTMR